MTIATVGGNRISRTEWSSRTSLKKRHLERTEVRKGANHEALLGVFQTKKI